ncbi:MAG: LysR family transcriptional regulator [Burkholderiales bacterium]|nr:LysR family transcriptional regulator [Burkholderiales bacterium]
MDQLQLMQVFMRVAEMASFTQAATSMGLPKASVSESGQKLEQQLGTRLLHRTTRRVQLTQDGGAYYERCKDLLADFEEAQTMFSAKPESLRGRLRVDMSSGIAQNIVLPQLAQFTALHPMLEIELGSTDRKVDVVREGYDCVIRVGTLSDSSLIAKPLGQFVMRNCASPAYVAQYGTPQSVTELATHRLIHYVPSLGGTSSGFEYIDSASGQLLNIAMARGLTVNNTDAYLAACLHGLGIIQVPEIGVREHLARGELVEILPHACAPAMPVNLLYPHRRQLARRLQVFIAWMEQLMLQ